MNLLKNFGSGGASMGGMGAAKPMGAKGNYFSTLKLQYFSFNKDKISLRRKGKQLLDKNLKSERVLQQTSFQTSLP